MWPIINDDDVNDNDDGDDGEDDKIDDDNNMMTMVAMSGKRENSMAKMPNEMFDKELEDRVYTLYW